MTTNVTLSTKERQAVASIARDAVLKATQDAERAAAAFADVAAKELDFADTLRERLSGAAWTVDLATVERFGERVMVQVTLVGRGALGYHVGAFIVGPRGSVKGEWSSRAY